MTSRVNGPTVLDCPLSVSRQFGEHAVNRMRYVPVPPRLTLGESVPALAIVAACPGGAAATLHWKL